MSKNDLDLQTFQIYQDEETSDAKSSEPAPKKKKFGLPSFKRKTVAAPGSVDYNSDTDSEGPSQIDIDGKGVSKKVRNDKSSKGSQGDILKGLVLGVVVVALIILADQLM